MRITLRQLKSIIESEVRSTLRESRQPRRRSLTSLIFEDDEKKSSNPFDMDEDQVAQRIKTFSQLDNVDPVMAKAIVTLGNKDNDAGDDKIAVTPSSWPAVQLKPSQTTMQLGKSIGMAIDMLNKKKVGGDLGAIVSSDNHILDGHHRWSATILIDPEAEVKGFLAEMPGEQLLPVLNVVTKGVFGVNKGNPGSGDIGAYTPENIEKGVRKVLENGTGGKFNIEPEKVKQLLEEWAGSVEEAIEKMKENVQLMDKNPPSWAPDRIQMPVIDPKQVPQAAKIMSKGLVDLQAPYSANTERAMSGAKRSKEAKEDRDKKESLSRPGYMVERWQRLAGLIK